MTPDRQVRRFERFSQADASTTRRSGGTGLGLSVTRAFVDMPGGGISASSAEGAGTTFTLRVAALVAFEPGGTEAGPHPVVAPSDSGASGLVLVVVDPSSRDLIARSLERDGFALATAADGHAGMEAARSPPQGDPLRCDHAAPGRLVGAARRAGGP